MTIAMGGYVMSSAIGSQARGAGPIEPMPLDTSVSPDGGGDELRPAPIRATPTLRSSCACPSSSSTRRSSASPSSATSRAATTSSEDVTSQYVDLQARLRHYRAVDRRLVGFLSQTTTVNQMLAVQDRIDKVQLTIEELSAQLKSMQETTTYGTLSVYVSEKDRTPAAIHAGGTFGGTFWNSIAAARPRRQGHGARADRPAPLAGRPRRGRRRGVVRRAAGAAGPAAGGAAVPAGLTFATRGRRLYPGRGRG